MKGQPLIIWGLLLGSWMLVRAQFMLDEVLVEKRDQPVIIAGGKAASPQLKSIDPRIDAVSPRNALPQLAISPSPVVQQLSMKPNDGQLSLFSASPDHPFGISKPAEPAPKIGQAHSAPQPIVRLRSTAKPNSRLSGDLWLFTRNSSGIVSGTALGASQGGGRLRYRLSPGQLNKSIAASLRFATPLQGRGMEISPGLSLAVGQKLPVELIIERRIRPDQDAQDQWAILAAAGLPTTGIAYRTTVEGYAQAGIVGVKQKTPFIQIGVGAHRTMISQNNLHIKVGAGLWADQQKSTRRVDLGPELVALAKAGERPFRLSAQWRFKVSGNAKPGSGPSLSVATSF